jgi:hypothetical protein
MTPDPVRFFYVSAETLTKYTSLLHGGPRVGLTFDFSYCRVLSYHGGTHHA